MADVAVQFIKVDEASEEELKRLEKLNILIREKHIPIANLGFYKPGDVVKEVSGRIPHRVDMNVHTRAWRHYGVRPPTGDSHPERTMSQYCVYDDAHQDYLYTKAWVDKLTGNLADSAEYERVVGHPPISRTTAA